MLSILSLFQVKKLLEEGGEVASCPLGELCHRDSLERLTVFNQKTTRVTVQVHGDLSRFDDHFGLFSLSSGLLVTGLADLLTIFSLESVCVCH